MISSRPWLRRLEPREDNSLGYSLEFTRLEKLVGIKLLEGLLNIQIAQDLGTSPSSVGNAVSHMLDKTGMDNRVALALHLVKYPQKLLIDASGNGE
jgi:DNA-binding NarL/FixJ family response regulator